MAHTVGITGLVDVPDTDSLTASQTGRDLYTLLGQGTGGGSPYTANLQVNFPAVDTTAFASSLTSASSTPDIGSWTGTINMRFPNPGAKTGAGGLVTFSSGYAVLINQWAMNIAAAAFDTTAFASTPPSWRSFIPGLISASGSYAGGVDSSTALTLGASGSATFRMSDESGTDNTLAASIFYTGINPAISVNALNQVSHNYQVSGAITAAGDTPLLPSGAIGTPDTTEIVVTAASGRTYTGFCFWTSIAVNVAIGSAIDVVVGIQGTGALTAG